MLLIISERESYSSQSLAILFNKVIEPSSTSSAVYILIHHTSAYPISTLITQLGNIYDETSKFNLVKKSELSFTVILEYDEYDRDVASDLWSNVIYTSNVDIEEVNNSYIGHISKENIKCFEIENEDDSLVQTQNHHRISNPESVYREIPVVAVGGTFDHLHDGHKILLTASAFLTRDTLIVGVTGPELLKNKKYKEYMESYEKRVSNVKSLLKAVRPNLHPDIYEINDVCGPTAKIEKIDALVVSLESAKGADYVNNVRSDLGWNMLSVYTIGVVGSSDSETFETKLSSTEFRKRKYLKDQSKKS